jgi:hypothetical protein
MIRSILKAVGLWAVMNMVNDATAYYRPGHDISCYATVPLTGKRLCAIVGNRQSGPLLSATSEGGLYQIGAPATGGRVFGVVARDCLAGEIVAVKREGILPVKAGASINAFAEVEVDANGQVIPKAAGIAIGYALTGCANGADAEIQLYNR